MKKLFIIGCLMASSLSSWAFTGYYQTTCGLGGGAMEVSPCWSVEQLLNELKNLNERYCGIGSGIASYSADPFPTIPQTETPDSASDENEWSLFVSLINFMFLINSKTE